MDLKEQRAAALKQARNIAETAQAEGRDMTATEVKQANDHLKTVDDLDRQLGKVKDSKDLVARLSSLGPDEGGPPSTGPDGTPAKSAADAGASKWAQTVASAIGKAGQGMGVKTLLSGEVATPSAVEVAPLPEVPHRLLDLIPRAGLDEHTYSYLRQTVATSNAAAVADGSAKPTSVFTFEEIEDRARVVAHLSEPFPVRYADDHASVLQVLDAQMRAGIQAELERLVVAGDSTVADEWNGLLNTTGVGSVSWNTDLVTTLRSARTAQESKGERVTAVAMHPNDAQKLDLLRESGSSGAFLMDGDAYERLFGPGVSGVPSNAVPQGTALIGDWNQVRLRVRETAATLAATQVGDLFAKNQMLLRAEGRFGFQLLRPQAFATVALSSAA